MLLTLLGACVYPATEVEVLVGTDIDPSVPLTVTAHVTRGGDAGADPIGRTWVRVASDAGARSDAEAGADARGDAARPSGMDAGSMTVGFPFEFLVVPGSGPRDGTVHLFIEANAGGVVFRRQSAFTFLPHRRTTLPIFLSNRCALVAPDGCTGTGTCTQARHCEEQGLTCGDDGQCVPIQTSPSLDPDASFGDVSHPLGPCGAYGQGCCALGAACQATLSCVAGRCQRCLDTAEACCDGADLRMDGTTCAATSDPCKVPGVCTAGVCGAIGNAPDNTVCAPTSAECRVAGVCTAGACGAIGNARDGSPCGAAPDACHAASACAGGACVAGAAQPDGTPWGSGGIQRCCGGNAVTLDTTSNCNACGLACRAGPCTFHAAAHAYFCTCAGANAQCAPQICRSTAYPDGNTCEPSNGSGNCTGVCPNGSSCHMQSGEPDYCGY